MDRDIEPSSDAMESREIASGNGWRISEFVCHAGPHDRPFEEQHTSVSIAAVAEGSFRYRSSTGTALLYPGALLLGNAGTCFECGHDHSVGDRCLAFHFAPTYFGEIAASVAGTSRFRFGTAMLPALRALAPCVAAVEAAAQAKAPDAMDELAIRVAERVLETASGEHGRSVTLAPRDQKRIAAVLRHIEENSDTPLDLASLAAVACMSKYHFLRSFRRITGVTPHQYLLGVRLRRAAVKLTTTPEPISAIAYDCGFGDLSTFNAQFRDIFAMNPGAFRKASA